MPKTHLISEFCCPICESILFRFCSSGSVELVAPSFPVQTIDGLFHQICLTCSETLIKEIIFN